MKRILVGVDFSEPSRDALTKAVELAEGSQRKILALHVVEQTLIDSLADVSHLDSDQIIGNLKLRLSGFASEIQSAKSFIETRLVVGHPVKEFAKVADSFEPDLVILGAWGSHGFTPDRAGFTAKQIVQECRCDTLLTRRPNPGVGGILACIDFSPYDRPVVKMAGHLSRLTGEPLEVLHVFFPPWKMEGVSESSSVIADEDFAQEYKALLDGRIESVLLSEGISLLRAKTTVQESLKHSEGILSYIRESKPHLVVLGARGGSRIESMILGRIAERIVTGSGSSVYIVKRPE